MIESKEKLKDFIQQDAIASQRKTIKPRFFGDEVWKYTLLLRKYEYYSNQSGLLNRFLRIVYHYRWHKMSVKLGFVISANVFDKGLSIAHYGNIVVHNNAKVGQNCRIHEGVNIGATNGSTKAPIIGNNVFIGSGAKIIGDIHIADDVAIGAGAVVIKSIVEPGTSWGGVPAKKISNNNSHTNLAPSLFTK